MWAQYMLKCNSIETTSVCFKDYCLHFLHIIPGSSAAGLGYYDDSTDLNNTGNSLNLLITYIACIVFKASWPDWSPSMYWAIDGYAPIQLIYVCKQYFCHIRQDVYRFTRKPWKPCHECAHFKDRYISFFFVFLSLGIAVEEKKPSHNAESLCVIWVCAVWHDSNVYIKCVFLIYGTYIRCYCPLKVAKCWPWWCRPALACLITVEVLICFVGRHEQKHVVF